MTTDKTLVTAPVLEPISLQEAKDHMRVDHTDDDMLVVSLITAAREYSEMVMSRSIITQTWDVYLDAFADKMKLPVPPLQSVDSIKYIDTEGVEQTLDIGVYTVNTSAMPGYVSLAYKQSWPSIRDIDNAVTIRITSGYGDSAADVPAPVKQAMLLLIGHLYENREASQSVQVHNLPLGYDALIYPYRQVMI